MFSFLRLSNYCVITDNCGVCLLSVIANRVQSYLSVLRGAVHFTLPGFILKAVDSYCFVYFLIAFLSIWLGFLLLTHKHGSSFFRAVFIMSNFSLGRQNSIGKKVSVYFLFCLFFIFLYFLLLFS